ncbi:MAG TPA: hypothetical protein VGC35_00295 [Allosphingosinicella sp.]
MILLNWDSIKAAKYVGNISDAAASLVASLTIIAVIMERALAVINSAWLAEESEAARAQMRSALTRAALLQKAPAGLLSADDIRDVLTDVDTAVADDAAVEAKKKRIRVVVGFLFGLAISAAGVRSLAALVEPDPTDVLSQINLFNAVDIVVTAALLAGGSDGMAKLAQLLRIAIDRTITKLNGNTVPPAGR